MRADGDPGHLHLHARLDRRRRGRPDAPAGRAARLAARHPRPVVLRPADANEVVEAWRVIMKLQPRAGGAGPDPPGAADPRPRAVRAGRRACARAPTCWPTPPDGKPEVLLLGTGSEVRCASRPTSSSRPRASRPACQHAVVGPLRAPAAGVPRQRAAAERHGAGLGRAGLDVRLGALRRHAPARHRHAHLRRLGAAEGRCRRSSASRRSELVAAAKEQLAEARRVPRRSDERPSTPHPSGGQSMSTTAPVVFLVDVDNTLLDNDAVLNDLRQHVERELRPSLRGVLRSIQEGLWDELGYRDYLGALQRYRVEHPYDARLPKLSLQLLRTTRLTAICIRAHSTSSHDCAFSGGRPYS